VASAYNFDFAVVCPNHLAQQWADEIKKYTDLNVILYTTLENIKSLTYGDVVSAGTMNYNQP
jgi:superfamily II DNA or RNA helicase